MIKKIGVISLGCPKNLVDTEVMLSILKRNNYELTHDKDEADIIIINTCGFIESAKKESIETILEMVQCKNTGCELVIVTGCMAERYKEEIIKEIPEVDAVVGTGNYKQIAEVINKAYSGEKSVLFGNHGAFDSEYDVNNERILSTNKGYAYIKIAEGCDNCCTYCIIPSLRGRYRSRKIEDIVKEAEDLASQGVREVILVAQDTTRYGIDIYSEKRLVELVERISLISDIKWIRLLYCYPEEINSDLIRLIRDNPKVCKYLDIPVQHASDKILKLMGRRSSQNQLITLVDELKKQIPDIVLRTSVIVGFPGEDDNDFNILCSFIQAAAFDRLGVFTYSKEEGTKAYKYKNHISRRIKLKRQTTIMGIQKQIAQEVNQKRLGNEYDVIVEGVAEDGIFYYGRSFGEAPEIDNVVYFTSPDPVEPGSFVKVKILNVDEYDLIGEVVYESAK